ncbi:MAG: Rrf2 family transcriptional regulator [Candidatus Moranbacteria bacterium]|nr:Rrf2 family transcriptional regulator [Candidatus Moranbacteria bacterium]
MMKISKKAYYGLRAAVSLAEADGPVSARELAEREHIPEDFLEKILQKLRKVGIVESTKGVEGGYALIRKDISVWDILKSLDGPVRTFSSPGGKGTLPCDFPSHCRTNDVLRRLEIEIEKTLSGITINRMVSDKAQNPENKIRTEHEAQITKRNHFPIELSE